MRQHNAPLSVIVLLDGRPSADNEFIKRWFQKSRFLTCESTDIFQALEEITDFTTTQRPDVVLLEVDSVIEQFYVVRNLSQRLFSDNHLPIMVFSEHGSLASSESFTGNLAEIEERLNLMIPVIPTIPAISQMRKSIAA